MVLNIVNNPFHYEMEKLTMAFFPEKKITVKSGLTPDLSSAETITVAVVGNVETDESVKIIVSYIGEKTVEKSVIATSDFELAAARLLYVTLSEVTGITLPWGVLTGVRPSKLMHKLFRDMDENAAISYFTDDLLVSQKKANLAATVAKAELSLISKVTPDSFSLYISIPFCPTRCSYCSFVSSSIGTPSAKKLIPEYFENLLVEIEKAGQCAKDSGLKLMTAYVGGGTPGILTPLQTERLFETVNKSFDMSHCSEFTFEAGRPDTITLEKLKAAIDGGADRVSINPQTMSDAVLESVGRCHTEKQVYDAFEIARMAGFKNINMDLIAGLPTDTVAGFTNSVEKLANLSPEAITVHTLAYKRSASLAGSSSLYAHGSDVSEMVDVASNILYNNKYSPYYMYRQTKSVSNLENVGYAKPGFESAYNIYMMEECHSIISCGAGAVSKIKDPNSDEINRVFNFKYPYEYNSRFNEILNRKDEINGRIQTLCLKDK